MTPRFAGWSSARANPSATRWLHEIGAGHAFATVGISHLTTSRRLGATADEISPGAFKVEGTIPWVTAALARPGSGRRAPSWRMAERSCLPCRLIDRALSFEPPFPLAALQASCTAEVVLENVLVDDALVLAGPAVDVMSHPGAVGTAGLETSALALGQAHAALAAPLRLEPPQAELAEPLEVLCDNWQSLWKQLIAQARGEPGAAPSTQIRSAANSLVLRSTQAYLTVMKGTGFLKTEPAQRWARQALFFLVWSCPTPVAHAAIRDLAGLCQV